MGLCNSGKKAELLWNLVLHVNAINPGRSQSSAGSIPGKIKDRHPKICVLFQCFEKFVPCKSG